MVYWLAFYKDRIRVLPKTRFILSTVPAAPPGTLLYSEKKWDRSSESYTEQRTSVLKGLRARKAGRCKKREQEVRELKEQRKKGGEKNYKETTLISFTMRTNHFTITPLPISIYRQSPGAKPTRGRRDLSCSQLSQILKSGLTFQCAALRSPTNILAIWFCRVMVPSCQDPFSLSQFKRRSLSG